MAVIHRGGSPHLKQNSLHFPDALDYHHRLGSLAVDRRIGCVIHSSDGTSSRIAEGAAREAVWSRRAASFFSCPALLRAPRELKGTLVNLNKLWLVFAVAIAVPAQAGILNGDGIGAYGDSMSMQYSFWLPLGSQFGYSEFYNGTQLNWVDHLVQSGYNLGPATVADGRTYNGYDVAIAGATSADLAGQTETLQNSVVSGAAKLVVINMGANDFDDGAYSKIYTSAANHAYQPLNDPAVQTFMNTLVGNIASAITLTLAENASTHMILTTVPDMGITPSFKSQDPNAAQRAVVTQVIQAVDNQILSLGAQYHLPVVDLMKLGNLATNPPKIAGNQLIDAGGTSGKDIFLNDNFHPGTVVQGFLANAYLQADHVAYGDAIAPISDQTIVGRAGLTPAGSPSYFDVTPYVIFTPEPSSLALAAIAALACLAAATHKPRSRNG